MNSGARPSGPDDVDLLYRLVQAICRRPAGIITGRKCVLRFHPEGKTVITVTPVNPITDDAMGLIMPLTR